MSEDDIPQLENCLVAVIDGDDPGRAYRALEATGLAVLKLSGHDGDEPMRALKTMATALDGELRVLDEIYQELSNGNQALIVEVAPERLAEVSALLYRCRARSVWEYDELTFTKTRR